MPEEFKMMEGISMQRLIFRGSSQDRTKERALSDIRKRGFLGL